MVVDNVLQYLKDLITRYPQLNVCRGAIWQSFEVMKESFSGGGKLLTAGNGGSAADSEHMAGELMKKFVISRTVSDVFAERLRKIDAERGERLACCLEKALPVIPLVAHEALTTAYMNDVEGGSVFAQQLFGYGKPGDVFVGISTSGNSQNILDAAVVAKAMNIKVIGLTGGNGGELKRLADISVVVPEKETFKIQELHLPVYHCWCQMLEMQFFG